MPYLDGKKVSNEEWSAAKGGRAVSWKEAHGWQEGDDAPTEAQLAEAAAPKADEAPSPRRRGRNKNKQAEAAVKAVTGLDIDIDAELTDTSGFVDPDLDGEPDDTAEADTEES